MVRLTVHRTSCGTSATHRTGAWDAGVRNYDLCDLRDLVGEASQRAAALSGIETKSFQWFRWYTDSVLQFQALDLWHA